MAKWKFNKAAKSLVKDMYGDSVSAQDIAEFILERTEQIIKSEGLKNPKLPILDPKTALDKDIVKLYQKHVDLMHEMPVDETATPAPHDAPDGVVVELRDERTTAERAFIAATRATLGDVIALASKGKELRAQLMTSACHLVKVSLNVYDVEQASKARQIKTDPFDVTACIRMLKEALQKDAKAEDEGGTNGSVIVQDKVKRGVQAQTLSDSGIFLIAKMAMMIAMLVEDVSHTSDSDMKELGHPFKLNDKNQLVGMIWTVTDGNSRRDENGVMQMARYAGTDANAFTLLSDAEITKLFTSRYDTAKTGSGNQTGVNTKTLSEATAALKPEEKRAIAQHYADPRNVMTAFRGMIKDLVNAHDQDKILDIFKDREEVDALKSAVQDLQDLYFDAEDRQVTSEEKEAYEAELKEEAIKK